MSVEQSSVSRVTLRVGVFVLLAVALFAAPFFFASTANAAETAVDTSIFATNSSGLTGAPASVCVDDQKCFVFYLDSAGGISMASSTNGGTTWTSGRNVDSVNTTDAVSVGIWWDGWTPGTSTTRYIHIATTDTGVDDTYYTRYDITNNTFSTTVLATTQAAACTLGADCYPTITMTSDGALYMATAEASDRWVVKCTTDCTNTANWAEITGGFQGTNGDDYSILMPIPGTNNILLTWWDISADAIYYNVYSATSSSWWQATTVSVATAADDNTTYDAQLMGMAIASSTGQIVLTFVDDANDYTTVDHDIKFYTYASSTGWTAKTNVVTNAGGGITGAKVAYDAQNGTWYVIYGRRTEIATATTGKIYYRYSTNGGTTWSTEKGPVNSTADDINALTTGITTNERIAAFWNYTTAPNQDDLYYATVSDIYRSLTVSGVLYEADRSTPVNSSQDLILALATSTPARYATTSLTTSGVYTYELDDLRGVASDRTNAFTLFVDGNASLKASALFTIANTTAITDLDLYQDHVSFYGLDTEINVSDLYDEYDSADDSDIQFTASSSLGRLTVADGQTLLVATSTTFHIDASVVTGGFEVATTSTVLASSSLTISGDFIQNGTFRSMSTTSADWTIRTSAADNAWYSVAYGNGLFVAVACGVADTSCNTTAGGSRIMTSPDGITWTARTAPAASWWSSVTYGNGLFVAVANMSSGTRIMTSPDGITWTARTAPSTVTGLQSVTYGNGLFVAVTNWGTDHVMTSPDGITWTARAAAGNNDYWNSVTYGNGLFVAVGDSGDRVMISPDGITWTARAAAGYWNSVTYGNGLFVAVGDLFFSDVIMTSPDGITWTARSVDSSSSWHSVTYGNGLFVAVSQDGTGRVMTSSDGITWTTHSAAAEASSWGSVTYGNGLFVAVAHSGTGNRVMTSVGDVLPLLLNGTVEQAISGSLTGSSILPSLVLMNAGDKTFHSNASATAITVDSTSGTVTAPTLLSVSGDLTNSSIFIAASSTYLGGDFTNSGTYIAGTSTLYFNGGNQSATGTMVGTSALSNVTLSGGQKTFLTNASTTDLVIESDAEFLSPPNLSVSGDYTNNGTTTVAGAIWTARSAAENNLWTSVTYGEGLFVAVGCGVSWCADGATTSLVMTSPDGITWTVRTAAASNGWSSVTYGNGLFVAVADCGGGSPGTNCVMTSPDGITWTDFSVAGDDDEWHSVTYGNGLFVAVSNCFDSADDCVMTSPDGATWTVRNNDLGVVWSSVTYGNGTFVAVGQDYVSGEGLFTSSNGISWTKHTPAITLGWSSPVTYGNGLFVAAGDGVMTSPDGINWTSHTAVDAGYWESITYGNGLFVAVGWNNDLGEAIVATSPDGSTWTSRTAVENNYWTSAIYGNGLFVAVSSDGTNRVMTSAVSSVTFDGASAQSIDGSLVGASAFGDVAFTNTGTKTFGASASTSDFYITTGATVEVPVVVTIIGDYTNYGTSTMAGSSVFLAGGAQQTATGTMIGASAFNNLTITNASQEGSSTQSVIFGASASTTGTLTMLPGTSAQFPAGATSTFENIDLAGSFGQYVTLRSSTPGTQFSFYVPGTQTQVSFVDVKDSNACPITISVFNGVDAGNNTCWDITALLTLSGQLYSYDATSPLSAAKTLGIMAGTSTLSLQTVTTDSSGFWYYMFPEGHTIDAGTPLLVWVDDDATTHAAVLTKAAEATTNIAGIDLYQDHLIVRHEGVGTSTTNADLALYDGDDDTDLQYTSNSGDLAVQAGTGLYVWSEDTFAPGGEVILHGNASASSTDGALTLAASSTYTTSATTSIASNFISDPTATLTNTGVMQFTASTTGKVIDVSQAMGNVLFSNTETVAFSSSATTTDFTVEAGATVVAPERLVVLGDYSNEGTVSYELGSLWTARSVAGDNDRWNSIAYGNGLFVAVGDCVNEGSDDCVMTSPDGITWTVRSAAGNDDIWVSVTYGNGLFVAVGGGGEGGGDRVMTSPDGITWTARTAAEDNWWNSVTYGNSLFVAVGELDGGTNLVMTSPDGITWTSRTAAEADWWNSVTYGNSLFVAVTDSGTNRVMTSPDGITWTARTPAEVVPWSDVTYGNGLFVATGFDWDLDETHVMTSPDGITWTSRTPAISDIPIWEVVYAGNQFVGVGTNWSTGATAAVTSPDGITWTPHATAEDNGWYSLAYGNDIVVASGGVNLGTNVVMTSSLPTTIFSGTAQQTATGTLSGASAFGNLTIANTSQEGSTTQSVVFGAAASTTGTFTMLASTSAQFLAGASSTFQNIDLAGEVGQYVVLRSSDPGTQFGFVVLDGQSVSYVDVKDSTACPSTIYASDGTSIDSGNNLCWDFGDIILVGTLYSDEGVSPITSGKTIKLVVGTTTPVVSTRVSDGGGEFTFALGSNYLGTSTPILLFVDGDSVKAALFTKASSSESNLTGLDLYQNHVIVSQEGSDDPTTITEMAFYDSSDDSDIQYMATSSPTTTLAIAAGNKLYIAANKAFLPGGNVSVHGNAGSGVDGAFHIGTGATYVGPATTTVAGSFIASSTATFYPYGTLNFTASTTGKTITTSGQALGNVAFNNTSPITFATNATTTDLTINAGATIVAPADNLTITGDYHNVGTFTHNSGTTTFLNTERWTVATTTTWGAITYGNGLFVAVGSGVVTSPDGVTWTARTAASSTDWTAVTYGNGLFVAVGLNSVMTSPDGITWTARTSATSSNWVSVAYGNGIYVVTSTGEYDGQQEKPIMTSPDGITWTERSIGMNPDKSYVLYGNGKFVAACRANNYLDSSCATVFTSPDGINWTEQTAFGNAYWDGFAYGNGLFVLAGSYCDADCIITSPDGVTWTKQSTPANFWITSISYGNGLFIAAGWDQSTYGMKIITSSDGVTWSVSGEPSSGIGQIAYGENMFVTLNEGGVMTVDDTDFSTTGNITQQISGDLTNASGFGTVVIVGTSTRTSKLNNNASTTDLRISSGNLSSSDTLSIAGTYDNEGSLSVTAGTQWISQSNTSGSYAMSSITYGNGLFVAVGNFGNVMTSPDGITWTARTGDDDNWASVTHGNGLFVAVGGSGDDRVITSPDGVTWTARSAAGNNDYWTSVTYGNNTFVAVGYSGDRVMTSPDGITWTARSVDGDDDNWNSVTYGNGLFVAVSGSGDDRVITSPDGVTWTGYSTTLVNDWSSVSYGGGIYVAVAYSGAIMTSPDGITWTERTAPEANDWYSVTYGNGLFVAVSSNGTHRVLVSSDGVTWNVRDASEKWPNFVSVTYGNGTFVAVTYSGFVMTSEDATVYFDGTSAQMATGTLSGASALGDVVFANGGVKTFGANASTSDFTVNAGATVVAPAELTIAGDYTNNGTSSYAGTKWTPHTSATANSWITVTHGNGLFVSLSWNGAIMTSPDGITWASSTPAVSNKWISVTYGNGLFVALAAKGGAACDIGGPYQCIMTSPDGITWTARTVMSANDWSSVTYGNGLFVAVRQDGLMTSLDGITWTERTEIAGANSWSSVTYGNGLFVAVASNAVMTSPDGITWTSRTSAADNSWISVTYGNGLFVAVANTGTNRVMTSFDGITWTPRTAAENNNWRSVTYGNGLFVAVANTGTNRVMTSFDGITWTSRTAAEVNYWYSVTYGNGLFVSVGGLDAGTHQVMTSGTTLTFGGASDQTVSGSLVGASALNKVVVNTVGTTTFSNNASTSVLSINTDSTVIAPTKLSVFGDYTNNGTFKAEGGEVVFLGNRYQTATGTLSATSSFYDLTLTNTSGGTTSPAVIFGAPVTTTNIFTMHPYTSAALPAGATSTFQNVDWQGASSTAPVILRSTSDGDQWYLDIPGSQLNVEYVDVQDSNASSSVGGTVYAATSTNSGNNSNWDFSGALPPETPTGSSTLANHDDTQVPNAFSYQNVTNSSLFAFKLIPESGNATVTNLVVTISGAKNIDTNDFSNIRLYKDHDNDAQYDASDEQVSAGSMSLSGRDGALTFTTDFLSTTTTNYLVVADWTAPENGSFLRLALYQSGVTAIDGDGTQDIYGAVNSVQHNRNNKGGGGGTAAAVGGPAPEGDGDVSGGTEEGGEQVGDTEIPGEQIGDPVNYQWPTAHSGTWQNGAYAYDRTNNTHATTSTESATASFLNHDFSIPGGNTITGIEVKLEVSASTGAGDIGVQLSYDGGNSWTTTKTTPTLTTSDVIATLGGPADTWGRAWTPANFSNANFVVRLTGNPSTNTVRVDGIVVRVYHQAGGGGAGGGGEI